MRSSDWSSDVCSSDLLARKADVVATAYTDVRRLSSRLREKTVLVGNPVRAEVRALRDLPYPALTEDGLFRVLVVGGSQGAKILSDVVPEGLGMLPPNFRSRDRKSTRLNSSH